MEIRILKPILNVLKIKTVIKNFYLLFLCLPIVALCQNSVGRGTGFFISQDGYIATNYHVVRDFIDYGVYGINGDFHTIHYAELVAKDEINDLAILKVDVKIKAPIPYSFQDQEDTKIGSDLYTIGYPLGFDLSKNPKPSNGILIDKKGKKDEPNLYLYNIDTEKGNSGSPVFDLETGNVIAVHVSALGLSEKHSHNRGIKIYYLKNLIMSENLDRYINMETSRTILKGKNLPDQLEIVRNHIVLIECYQVHHNAKQQQFEKLISQADTYYAQQNYIRAAIAYYQALKLFPNDPHAKARFTTIKNKLDNLFLNYLALSEEAIKNKQYDGARKYIEEAKSIYPDDSRIKNLLTRLNNTVEGEFKDILSEADKGFKLKRYEESKTLYRKALTIIPGDRRATTKINEINEIIPFLKNRITTIYDYRLENRYSYQSILGDINRKAKDEIEKLVLTGSAQTEIRFVVDTFGVTTYSLNDLTNSSSRIIDVLNKISQSISLQPTKKYGYPVTSEAKFTINIDIRDKVVSARKNNKEISVGEYEKTTDKKIIESLISDGPMGNYQVRLRSGTINDLSFLDNKIVKYKGTGGPSNAFKSLLVPGLGVKAVTGGEKNGIKRTAWTYLFIASGIGCKIGSDSEYKKYHDATDQESIDKYYESANDLNKAFYGLLAAGALIWTYDILWVTTKGGKNKKEQRGYKKSLFLGYIPSRNGQSLTLTLNF